MCGEFDDEDSLAEELYQHFTKHAQEFLEKLTTLTPRGEDAQLYTYLDALFRTALKSAAEPEDAPPTVSGYDRLRMEPLVYARLAGFMAAHQPLDEDPLRRLIEALMTGYAEGEEMLAEHEHDPSDHHGHTH
jgi:hypothetical protein